MKSILLILSLLFFGSFSISITAQTQVGENIVGETNFNFSGMAISLSGDGNRLAIGAPFNNGNGTFSGHVRVYDWINDAWTNEIPDIDGEFEDDFSGMSVSLSSDGNRLAIGAEANDGNGMSSGHVRVFELGNNNWEQLGMDIDGESEGDNLGTAVALSSDGSRLAIGARNGDGDEIEAGYVQVFELVGNSWEKLGGNIKGEEESDHFGAALSFSSEGNKLAIGGWRHDESKGHVKIFEWANDSWNQLGMEIEGDSINDVFGHSVALSGNGSRVAIGAALNDTNGAAAGQAKVFEWKNNSWEQLGASINGDSIGSAFGYSIDISSDGNRLAVGGTLPNTSLDSMGNKVKIFDWVNGAWVQVDMPILGETSGFEAGHTISLSDNGERLGFGLPRETGDNSNDGVVRVFEFSPITITSTKELVLKESIDFYPNPTDGNIYFSESKIKFVKIYDAIGKLVYYQKEVDGHIAISNMDSGIYFIQFFKNNNYFNYKVVKK